MNKTLSFGWAVALAALLTGACTQEPLQPTQAETTETGTLKVKPYLEGAVQTRVVSTQAINYENEIMDTQLLVFDQTGYLAFYSRSGAEVTETEMPLRVGTYQIWAVTNGPDLSGVINLNALQATMMDFGRYNDPESGFVMSGSTSCTVVANDETECSIPLTRYAARIILKKIRNHLPEAFGSVRIEYAVLTNVVSQLSINGTPGNAVYYNPMGRALETPLVQSHVICPPAYEPNYPELTFYAPEQDEEEEEEAREIYHADSLDVSGVFYAFANNSAAGWGFASEFVPRRTRLVVKATIDNRIYYYPVTLANLQRNTCYEIDLTLIGLGSDDPEAEVVKGRSAITLSVVPWQSGEEIVEYL